MIFNCFFREPKSKKVKKVEMDALSLDQVTSYLKDDLKDFEKSCGLKTSKPVLLCLDGGRINGKMC